MIELFQAMLWPICACVLLPALPVYFGLQSARRGTALVDFAIPQMAVLGGSTAFLLGHTGWSFQAWALGFAWIGAAIVTVIRGKQQRLPTDIPIAALYLTAAAAVLLVLHRSSEGAEELKREIVGELLLVNRNSVYRALFIYLATGAICFLFRNRLPSKTTNTSISGDFAFYALLSVPAVCVIQSGGFLLVVSYLVLASNGAALLATGMAARWFIGWVISAGAGVFGVYLAYKFDLPVGAVIVCVLSAALALSSGYARLRRA